MLVTPIDAGQAAMLGQVIDSQAAGEPVALATMTSGEAVGARMAVWPDRTSGSLGDPGLDAHVAEDVRGMLAQGQSATRHYGVHGRRMGSDCEVFVQSFAPPPHMIVFGAIDFAAAVARIGVFMGYHVTVCDARAVFATPQRFPEAHEVVCDWPHRYLERAVIDERTVICVLTHDPKFDIPALELALRGPAAYVGAMGSRRTHEDRLERLREAGLGDAELARLASPIGLDIGASTPEETAVSIAADIIGRRVSASGLPLSTRSGPIHHPLEHART